MPSRSFSIVPVFLALAVCASCSSDDDANDPDPSQAVNANNHEVEIAVNSGPLSGNIYSFDIPLDEVNSVFLDNTDSLVFVTTWSDNYEPGASIQLVMLNETTVGLGPFESNSSILLIFTSVGNFHTYRAVSGSASVDNVVRDMLTPLTGMVAYDLTFDGVFDDLITAEEEAVAIGGSIKIKVVE